MGSMTMYTLENTPTMHVGMLSQILQSWSHATPNLCLISSEGHTVYTSKVLVAMHSKMLEEILSDPGGEELVKISLQVSANSLVNLIKVLSQGISSSEARFDPLDILGAADALGISLQGLQVGRDGDKEEFVLDKQTRKIKCKIEENNEDLDLVDITQFKEDISVDIDDGSADLNHAQNVNINDTDDVEIESNVLRDEEYLPAKQKKKGDSKSEQQKSYKCDKCYKCFTQRGHLFRHKILHTGLKQFKCDECGRQFNRSDNMKNHLKVRI